jgi:hypothetical protein
MECDRIKILLSAYLDGQLEEQEQRLVEEHLQQCSSCRNDLKALRDYLEIARSIPLRTAPDDLMENTWQAVRTREATPILVKVSRSRGFQLISSLAAAAVIILYLAIDPNFLNTTHVSSDFTYQVIKKGKGPGESKGTMRDGSKEVNLLKQFAAKAEGQVLEESFNSRTGMTDFITVRIPKKNFTGFKTALEEAGVGANLPDELSPMVRFVSIRMYFPGRKILVGDVNGDGRSDMAAYFKRGKNTGQWYVAVHLKETEFAAPEKMQVGDSTIFLQDFETPLFADLNGNGLADLVIAAPGLPWQTFVNQGGSIFKNTRTTLSEDGLPSPNDPFMPLTGDFNGDGLDDIAVHYIKGDLAGQWFISVNQGNLTFDDFTYFSFPDNYHADGLKYLPFVLDFNGDGYDDAGKYWQQGELNASWFIGINDKKERFLEPFRVYFGNSPLAFQGDYLPFTGDFGGDGFDDLIVKSGTQDETGDWYLLYNEGGIKFTYGYDVKIGDNPDFSIE